VCKDVIVSPDGDVVLQEADTMAVYSDIEYALEQEKDIM